MNLPCYMSKLARTDGYDIMVDVVPSQYDHFFTRNGVYRKTLIIN